MLCDLHFFSKALAKHVGGYVIVPDAGEPPFAAFYLLHGLSDDYTIWLRRTSIERYAQQYPLIVVMPDGFRGFYTDNAAGPAYASYVAEELVATIERTFPAKRARASRGIGGLSMGGYGALRLALGYPHVFAAANSHSGAVLHGSRNHPRAGGALEPAEFQRIFGPAPAGTDHDLLALAQRCKSHDTLPKIRIDCGTEDDLLGDNREFHKKLEALRVAHEYEEFPGAHDWAYWDRHVQTALAFQHEHLA
jgi:S-formylglutathione hydrolase FrmB